MCRTTSHHHGAGVNCWVTLQSMDIGQLYPYASMPYVPIRHSRKTKHANSLSLALHLILHVQLTMITKAGELLYCVRTQNALDDTIVQLWTEK